MSLQMSATDLARRVCDRLGISYTPGVGSATLQGVPIEHIGNLFSTTGNYEISCSFGLKTSSSDSMPYRGISESPSFSQPISKDSSFAAHGSEGLSPCDPSDA